MIDPQEDNYVSWLAAQFLDSVRNVEDTALFVPFKYIDTSSLSNELSLVLNSSHVKAVDMSFFEPLMKFTHGDDPLRYLMSKCINQRCQVRKFESVAIGLISSDVDTAKQFDELVLCSLLGNYRISDPSSRPIGQIRDTIFDLVRGVDSPCRLVVNLLKSCRSVVMFCLREYIVFAVGEQPAVMERVSVMMQFARYASIVRSAMSCLRDYISRVLVVDESSFYRFFVSGDETAKDWMLELQFIMKPFDMQLLRISYRRPKQSFREFMLAVGNRMSDVDQDGPIDLIPELVSPDEVRALRALAERLIGHPAPLIEMVDFVDSFGVSGECKLLVQRLMLYHHTGEVHLDDLKRCLRELHRTMPRVFQLIQICAELIEDTHRVRIIGRLPATYLVSQIEACQGRFGTRSYLGELAPGGVGSILEHLCYFVYCDVCFATYSLLAEWKSVYKQDYNFGLRDAVMDYQTGELFCHRARSNYRGSCSDQPLKRILLLGHALAVKGQIVMMCGQENCGRAMKLQPRCRTNARGRACCYCTYDIQPGAAAMQSLINHYNRSQSESSCLYCGEHLPHSSKVWLYPHLLFVCRKHQFAQLVRSVTAFVGELEYMQLQDDHEKRQMLLEFMISTIKQRETIRLREQAAKDKRLATS